MSRIAKIKQALTPDAVLTLCHAWLPGGKLQGRCYMVCSPFRKERAPSFAVYIKDGGWWDYGGGSGGDVIDLCQRLHNVSIQDAIEAFEQMLGLEQ